MKLRSFDEMMNDYCYNYHNNNMSLFLERHYDKEGKPIYSQEALNLLLELDVENNGLATYFIGYLYFIGEVVEKNIDKATFYYKKSFNESGNIDSGLEVAKICFLYQKKYQESYNIYRTIITTNNHIALTALGNFYRNGFYVKKDLNKALEYYQKAIKYGNLSAPIRISGIYRQQRKYLKSLILLIKTLGKRIYTAITDKNFEEMFREM